LAESAELTNCHVEQLDFVALARRGGARDMDVVAAHGVLSWVARETQEAMMAIARGRLADGGMAMFSYDCLPGAADLLPLRQLMLAMRRASPGDPRASLTLAFAMLMRLRQGDAAALRDNPALRAQIDALASMDVAYLAHQFFCEDARPLAFAEAADLAARAGLAYGASTALSENFIPLGPAGDFLPALEAQHESSLRETLRDLMCDRRFRRDLYCRPAPLDEAATRAPDFMLAVPPNRIIVDFAALTHHGAAKLFPALLDRLGTASASFDQLAALEACRGAAPETLREALALLIEAGQIVALTRPPAEDGAPARRFNREVVERARRGCVHGHLASPVARGGLPVDEFGLLALAAFFDGEAQDSLQAARRGLEIVTRLDRRPAENGAPIEDDARAEAFLADRLAPYIEDWFDVWRRLGAI
jgi:hypothetical protein